MPPGYFKRSNIIIAARNRREGEESVNELLSGAGNAPPPVLAIFMVADCPEHQFRKLLPRLDLVLQCIRFALGKNVPILIFLPGHVRNSRSVSGYMLEQCTKLGPRLIPRDLQACNLGIHSETYIGQDSKLSLQSRYGVISCVEVRDLSVCRCKRSVVDHVRSSHKDAAARRHLLKATTFVILTTLFIHIGPCFLASILRQRQL